MLNTTKNSNGIDIKSIPLPAPEISDEDIILKIKSEGFIAYGELVKRYNQLMFRMARSVITDDAIAMDIVQESHIKAYKNLHSFQGIGSFSAWLASITRNEALMYLRKNTREVTMGEDEQNMVNKHYSNQSNLRQNKQPDDILQNQNMQDLISKNLDKLPEKFRSVFVLRAVEQYSTKETAEILNINEITVKTRYFRSKLFLKKAIQIQLDASDLPIYEFGNCHCDTVLFNVLTTISKL